MERESIDLCGVWRFLPDPGEEGERAGYADPGHDITCWGEAALPATFEHCSPALASYEGAVWFRRTVGLPAAWAGRRISLDCGAANYHARAWVNGDFVGENEDGFLPFSFVVGEHLCPGAENVVVLRVDNLRRDGDVPGKKRGWRPYGGVLRELGLTACDPLHIAAVRTTAEPEGEGGRLTVTVEVSNERATPATAVVGAQVEGGADFTASVILAAGETATVELGGLMAKVTPWSPAHPTLYPVTVVLRTDGKDIDRQTLRVGFRRLEVQGERLLLNGQPVVLRGCTRHEDSPRTNQAIDLDMAERDLRHMKDLGLNFVRLCHYPHAPGELDLCDELGLLVMAEVPLYWWDGAAAGEEACARTLEAARRQLTRLIARDRNHPSVIFWSVSNETREDLPEVAAGNGELVRLAKSLDPTRLAVHVSDKWARTPSFADDDVVCVNAYPSESGRRRAGNPHYDLAESARWWETNLAALHARYPDKPILVAEFGYPCFADVLEGGAGEKLQADAIRAEFGGLQAPYVCGTTLWCYADHPWPEEDFVSHVTTSPFGVMTRDRRAKRALSTVQELLGRGPDVPHAHGGDDLSLMMIRPNLDNIPEATCPEGFSIRPMRRGEAALWIDLHRDAERLFSIADDLFENQFGSDWPATERRCYFLVTDRDVVVGTVSAWYSRDFKGRDCGRFHWFAIRPAYQGKGLARPAVTYALQRLAEWHTWAWLSTSTGRLPAVKLYLDYGFEPDLTPPGAEAAWRQMAERLNHPVLARFAANK